VHGLSGTPYAKDFLTHVAANAGFIAAAQAYEVLPIEIATMLAEAQS
jgi:hypothetical protein